MGPDFSPLKNIHTGFGTHPSSYIVDKRRIFSGDQSALSCAEVKNDWRFTTSSCVYFHDFHRANLIFSFIQVLAIDVRGKKASFETVFLTFFISLPYSCVYVSRSFTDLCKI